MAKVSHFLFTSSQFASPLDKTEIIPYDYLLNIKQFDKIIKRTLEEGESMHIVQIGGKNKKDQQKVIKLSKTKQEIIS